jgi:hypothetical protein
MGVGRFPELDSSSSRGGRRASFVRGLAADSPIVVAVAVLLLVPALLGVQAYFASGAWTAVPLEHWLRKPSDDWVYVSWTVGRNRQQPPSAPSVYLLGGSGARECIVSDASLGRRVERAGGPRVEVFDLGSFNQNFAQSLAVLDNVPDTPALLLVGVGPGRFTPTSEANQMQAVGRELLLDSPFLRRYVRRTVPEYRYSFTILPGVFNYLTSYVEQHKADLIRGRPAPLAYRRHRYTQKRQRSVEEKEAMVRRWNTKRAPVFRKNLAYNLTMLELLLERAREREVDVVLLELPYNDEIIGTEFDWARGMYQPKVHRLADAYGVPYLDFVRELPLTNRDFHDLSHLVEPGREIWEQRLAEELVAFYERHQAAVEAAATGGDGAVDAP